MHLLSDEAYVAFLVPKAAIGVNMAILVLILLVRPTGLFGAK